MKRLVTTMDSDASCVGDEHVWTLKRENDDPIEDDRCRCGSYTWAQAGKIANDEALLSFEHPVDDAMLADVRNRFTYHAPKQNQLPRYSELRAQGLSLAKLILRTTPKSREQALALTKLEEAIMAANAAIARHE